MNTREYGRIAQRLDVLHNMVFSTPEAPRHFLDAGLDGFETGYVGVRAAPMGEAGPSTVTATFYGFAPDLIARYVPRVWTLADPATLLSVRFDLVHAVLHRLFGDEVLASPDLRRAAALARRAAEAADTAGRPLAAGNQDVPWPDEPHLVLWQALCVLREHRGDGHIALLVDAELSGIEALITSTATGREFRPGFARASRGWTPGQWDAAVDGLRGRGLLDPLSDLALTPDGWALRDRIEAHTDRLGAAPWAALGPDGAAALDDIGGRLVDTVLDGGWFPSWDAYAPGYTRIRG